MIEDITRKAIINASLSWEGTPYRSCGRLKGVGTNCAQFIYAVYLEAKVLPLDAPEPRWYTPQLATHSKEERLIGYLLSYGAREIDEDTVKPGDVVAYKTGRAHGHLAIVIEWPMIIHCLPRSGICRNGVDDGVLAGFSRRYFTFKGV